MKQSIGTLLAVLLFLLSGCTSVSCERTPEGTFQQVIAFQGDSLPTDTTELTLTSLTREEADLLAAELPKLRKVHAENCPDLPALASLKRQRPGVQISYRVCLDGKNVSGSAVFLTLDRIAGEDLALLPFLPQLKGLTVAGGEAETLARLQTFCREQDITLQVKLKGQTIGPDTQALTLSGITEQELPLLHLLSGAESLHLPEPEVEAEALTALEAALDAHVTWEKTVFGLTFSSEEETIDLTPVLSPTPWQRPQDKTPYQRGLDFPVEHTEEEVRSAVKVFKNHPLPDRSAETAALIAEAETAMAYFPHAEKLVMCGCYLDNEAMAKFREDRREYYKVIWSVDCGEIAPRTDAAFFMPVKYHVYYLSTRQAHNLRYCEEMVAVDIGHMSVSDISFVEKMPNLQYLILAHTNVQSIEALSSCKNLKFLEVDHTSVQDLTPLQSCTALEDLNIGNTWCEVEPLKQMPWLKNLWMIFRGDKARELMPELPETNIVYTGTATVDSGWRDLPNYFAMRDELKMFYMSW